MKRELFVIGLLFVVVNITRAMEGPPSACVRNEALNECVVLPPEAIIRASLNAMGLLSFVNHSKLDKKLGDEIMYPSKVNSDVDDAIESYYKFTKNQWAYQFVQNKKWDIVGAILGDYPHIIACLKQVCEE